MIIDGLTPRQPIKRGLNMIIICYFIQLIISVSDRLWYLFLEAKLHHNQGAYVHAIEMTRWILNIYEHE